MEFDGQCSFLPDLSQHFVDRLSLKFDNALEADRTVGRPADQQVSFLQDSCGRAVVD